MTIKLTKDGKFLSRVWNPPTEWNEEARRYEDEGYYRYFALNNAEGILVAWKDQFILEEGVTLRSLMTALRDIPDIERIGPLVVNAYIMEFVDEAFTPPPEKDTQIAKIVWSWHTDYGKNWADGDNFDNEKANCREISDSLSIYGNVSGKAHKPDPEYGDINYSIDGAPQHYYMDVPLVLDETVEIRDPKEWQKVILTATKVWTLGEFLYTYLWELSWHGSPKGRDEFNEEMSRRLEEVMSDRENLKTYSLEDLDRAIMGDDFVDDLKEKGEYDGLPPG